MQISSKTPHSFLRLLRPLFVFLFFSSCTVGPVINSTYNDNVSFGNYQYYAWHDTELPVRITGNGPAYSPLLDQQIKIAVESELVKEGLRPNDEAPNLLIAYDIAVPGQHAPEADTAFAPGFGYGYSYWYGYRYRYDTTNLIDFKSITEMAPGTVVIDLIDANTNQLVWRGWYEAGIDPTVANTYDITQAVVNIMSRYPPVPQASQ